MGDFTRDTFRPSRHYSAVRQQQGRVHLDADWNEQVDIGHHLSRTTTADVVGPTGMPDAAAGFGLTAVPGAPGTDLIIGVGRAYVDGILVENTLEPTTLQRVSGADAAAIWAVTKGPRLTLDQWIDVSGGAPGAMPRVASIEPPSADGLQHVTFTASPGATDTVSVTGLTSVNLQPFVPPGSLTGPNNTYLAYLDVFEREISALEDPLIAETALNGPDTAVRTQVAWQVDIMAVPNTSTCKSFPAGWSPSVAAPMLLSAAAHPVAGADDPCELPEQGGYRSLDNQLYRVEVQTGGIVGTDEIWLKWSRDNGIFRSRLLDIVDESLVVEDTGNDKPTAFTTDDWLEVISDDEILSGAPGHFVEIGEIIGNRLGIRTILDPITQQPLTRPADGQPDVAVLHKQGLVRRWEGGKPQEIKVGMPLQLEAGIEVTAPLAGGSAVPGMYWLIPARTLTAAIEWPVDDATGASAALPPHGVKHSYCPLAILTRNNNGWVVNSDCRPIFPPLTKLEEFFYLGGDGQEAMPDLTSPATLVALDSPLRVGVARGRRPVAGRAVRFTVREPNSGASLGLLPGGTEIAHTSTGPATTTLIVPTGANGVAAVSLSIPGGVRTNHVVAELLDSTAPAQASAVHLPVNFTANASIAAGVAFDPSTCLYQNSVAIAPNPARTVQEAIDRLCPRLELLLLGGDSQLLCRKEQSKRPLRVGLYWGKQALKGVEVTFSVVSGDATVTNAHPITDADGIAETYIFAGSTDTTNDGLVEVVASVAGQTVVPAEIKFGARFLHAECVYGDTGNGDDPGIHVQNIRLCQDQKGDGPPIQAHGQIFTGDLVGGIIFELDRPINPKCLDGAVAGAVILDTVIVPNSREDNQLLWGDVEKARPIGANPMLLDGRLEIFVDGNGDAHYELLHFRFSEDVMSWLNWPVERPGPAQGYIERLERGPLPIQAVLYGNRIYDTDDNGDVYLDGNLFLSLREQFGVHYPSGDGTRGGDLSLPFYLTSTPFG